MQKKYNDIVTYDTLEERNLKIALTLILFVVAFGLTVFFDIFFLFNGSKYFLPKFGFAIIFTVLNYIFVYKNFIKFLGRTEIDEDLDPFMKAAVVLSCAIFVLYSILLFIYVLITFDMVAALLFAPITGNFKLL